MGGKDTSESAREREVFKYYQPPLGPNSIFLAPQHAAASYTARSSRDSALTAYAQLAALRLDAKRSTISFFAGERKFILAEATRTLSPQSDLVHDECDALWRGETIVHRSDGPCATAFDVFSGITDGAQEYFLANDLTVDSRFSHMDCVTGSPFMKAIISVPIISAQGILLGAFSVLDDKPRSDPSDAQIAFMKDVSITIMVHLESNRTKRQHQRAVRMIRGLGLYVEGKASIRDWWLITGHKSNDARANERLRSGESLEQQANEEFGVQDEHDTLDSNFVSGISSGSKGGSLGSRSALGSKSILTPAVSNESRPQHFRSYSDTSGFSTTSKVLDATFTQEADNSETAFSQNTSRSSRDPAIPVNDSSGARLQEATLSNELKESFSRASNLIRESVGVDGALFLDASIGTFGGSSTQPEIGFSGPSARNDAQGSTNLSTSSSDEQKLERPDITASAKCCNILGYSTSTRSSLNMHEPSSLHFNIAESFLRKLLRRYPHGKVFNFDEEGSLSSSEDELRKTLRKDVDGVAEEPDTVINETRQKRRKKKRMSKNAEAKEIARLLPGARSVAFFPLWDSHKERWFSGSVVWTRSATRVLDPDEDLTYLASFGNSIMAEVARLEALVKSQLKNSFVSSISHELRSPLHGVLASAEFLQDSPLNSLQQEMVNIVVSCGRTLLDTINHVLDFTKFTNVGKETQIRRKSSRAHDFTEHSMQTKNSVDIGVLLEEVLEGVYAGSGFAKSLSHTTGSSQVLPPMIITNIDGASDYCFDIEPGAWRRLVMNIFGNSLKYTPSGFVRVSLGCRAETKASRGSASFVTFTVSDSGKGISKEFLNHHIYTPFAQEDTLAVGSGLGLSIVQNIVNELAGSISIESEQDSGTAVTISLPLSRAKPSTTPVADKVLHVRKELQGREVCLVGFDLFPSLGDEPTGILSMEAKQAFYLKDSLSAIFRDWFGMEVVTRTDLAASTAAVTVIIESAFNDLLAQGFRDTITNSDSKKSILLVLCARLDKSYEAIKHPNCDIYYVQQPIGPHRLASNLAKCLASQSRSQNDNSATITAPTVPDTATDRSPRSEELSTFASVSQRLKLPTRNLSKGAGTHLKTAIFSPPILSSYPSNEDDDNRSGQSEASIASPIAATQEPLPSPPRVLLVEDNMINLTLLVTYMQKLGVEYATADNGAKAFQSYRDAEHPFALVIMDISMPVMDGLEASRKIRLFEQESKRNRVPIIALTGAASESARQEAFSAGIDQFLTKPVSLKVLREFVDHYDLLADAKAESK